MATERFVGNVTTHTPGILSGGQNSISVRPNKTELLVGGADGKAKLFRQATKAAPAGGGNPNQIREFMPRSFTVLGTDGFGRSDTRAQLREFFEVDRRYVVLSAMTALADEGVVSRADVVKVMTDLGIDPAKPDPTTV